MTGIVIINGPERFPPVKKIVVTGAAGFIGSSLVDRLVSRGDTVVGVDDLSYPHSRDTARRNLAEALASSRFTLVELDVRRANAVAALFAREQPDTVVHVGGRTGMRSSFEHTAEFHSVNVDGTRSVLDACDRSGAHMVLASSSTVYGSAPRPCRETDTLPPPMNPYAETKQIAERLTREFALSHGVKASVLRVFTVYGPRQREEMGVYRFTKAIDEGAAVPVYGDGSATRDLLYIDNCVDAFVAGIDNPFDFEIFNVGEENPVTLNDLVQALARLLGKPAIIEHVQEPRGIPVASFSDIRKAGQMLRYSPRVSLEEGLSRFIRWYLQTRKTP